jgi:hypothetical protein
MSSNEIDDISREFRQLGHAAASAVAQWQRRNPGKTKVPRKVRKDATRRLREAMRGHEQFLKEQRAIERDRIEQYIGNHRSNSLMMGQSAPGSPEQFQQRQWAHAQQRHHIAREIHGAQHLTREERGHAVMALTSAFYADNPRVKARPVWGPKPYGISALKARLAERVSRSREGLAQRLAPQAPKVPRAYAAPGSSRNHPYWSANIPAQDQVMNARMAQMENQLKELAEYRDREQRLIAERDQLQAKVASLGEKVLDARQQHKAVADDLAQRGQELTDAHTELGRVRGERDEAVQKLVERTPAHERLGSPERQAEQAKAAARTGPAPKTPPVPVAGEMRGEKPAIEVIAPQTPQAPQQSTNGKSAPTAPAAPTGPAQPAASKSAPATPSVAPKQATEQASAPERDLVGAAAGNARAAAVRINGSRKVPGATAPEIPLPPEPTDGLEPPEMGR